MVICKLSTPFHNCQKVLPLLFIDNILILQVSPNLSVTVVVSESGRKLANKMVALAVNFFNLVITSVTGIPMKVSNVNK